MAVTDSVGSSMSSTVAQCDVKIQNDSCLNVNITNIISLQLKEYGSLVSKQTQNVFLLQSMQVTLLYIASNMESSLEHSDDCLYWLFVESIELLHLHFGSNVTDLCQSDYVVVCMFSLLTEFCISWLWCLAWLAMFATFFLLVLGCGAENTTPLAIESNHE